MKGKEKMYNYYKNYSHPYYGDTTDFSNQFDDQYTYFTDGTEYDLWAYSLRFARSDNLNELKDYGAEPFVVNITEATKQNNTFRTALWTGNHLQLTLMSIGVGEDIGLEVHPHVDQFIRIEEGQGIVKMGDSKDNLNFLRKVYDDFAIFIPAGKWHNIINTGNKPLKLYSIYAPPNHPHGTIHRTKAEAEAAE